MMLLALLACIDQNVSAVRLDAIGVVLGDFDNVTEPLTGLDIATQAYNGFIVQATYEPEDERTQWDDPGPTVEGLLDGVDDKGKPEIEEYNAVFVNSGTRGFGAGKYNNTLEADDSLITDPDRMERFCSFGESHTLIVSDWAYDLVEYCWPDAIGFFGDVDGEAAVVDAAQVGIAEAGLLADVKDKTLKEALDSPTVSITFDYTAWSLMESVGADTEVLLSGDVDYQPSADELPVTETGAPMMVRFNPGRGQVIYTSFHWAAQTPAVAETLLLNAVEGLSVGAGSQSAEAAGD